MCVFFFVIMMPRFVCFLVLFVLATTTRVFVAGLTKTVYVDKTTGDDNVVPACGDSATSPCSSIYSALEHQFDQNDIRVLVKPGIYHEPPDESYTQRISYEPRNCSTLSNSTILRHLNDTQIQGTCTQELIGACPAASLDTECAVFTCTDLPEWHCIRKCTQHVANECTPISETHMDVCPIYNVSLLCNDTEERIDCATFPLWCFADVLDRQMLFDVSSQFGGLAIIAVTNFSGSSVEWLTHLPPTPSHELHLKNYIQFTTTSLASHASLEYFHVYQTTDPFTQVLESFIDRDPADPVYASVASASSFVQQLIEIHCPSHCVGYNFTMRSCVVADTTTSTVIRESMQCVTLNSTHGVTYLSIYDSVFDNCHANSSGPAVAGVLELSKTPHITLNNVTFSDNNGPMSGGITFGSPVTWSITVEADGVAFCNNTEQNGNTSRNHWACWLEDFGVPDASDPCFRMQELTSPCDPSSSERYSACSPSSDGCVCIDPFIGDNCDLNATICLIQQPCLNGGTCTQTTEVDYTCTCVAGVTGLNCETEINYCTTPSNPCENGATCVRARLGESVFFTCVCDYDSFYGSTCEIAVEECDSSSPSPPSSSSPTRSAYTGDQFNLLIMAVFLTAAMVVTSLVFFAYRYGRARPLLNDYRRITRDEYDDE